MSVSVTKSLVIDQGSMFEGVVRYLDPDRKPIDLTDFSASMFISKRNNPLVIIAEPVVTTNSAGEISWELDNGATSLIPKGTYDYVLNLISPDLEVHRLFRGQVEVRF